MRRGLIVLVAVALLVIAAGPATAKPPPESIRVTGAFAGIEADLFVEELNTFAKGRFIVEYDTYLGTADLVDRITGDDPPDIIVVPQPAALAEVSEYLIDLGQFRNPSQLHRDYGTYLLELVTVDDEMLGAPIRAHLKSLVWYRPDEFAANGYSIPSTFAELVALSDRMVADGRTPWCNFMGSGFATGWVGTDWVEDLLLGTEGAMVYDQWTRHDVLFSDPRVEIAFERYMQMVDTPGYVFQRSLMLDISFWDNADPLGTGECLMHKQATFFASAITDFGFDLEEFDTFKFPAVDDAFPASSLGGGDYVAALNEDSNVRKLMRYLTSKQFGTEVLAPSGVWLLPNIRFDAALYPDDRTRSWVETIQAGIAADLFRFDASDLMPPEVGTGSFWFAMTDLVAGVITVPDALTYIDSTWPD